MLAMRQSLLWAISAVSGVMYLAIMCQVFWQRTQSVLWAISLLSVLRSGGRCGSGRGSLMGTSIAGTGITSKSKEPDIKGMVKSKMW